ncbi:MAG: transposase [Deferrisomatales bacterium]
MARPLRVEFPGALYLVTARALPRQRLWRDDGELGDFLRRLPEIRRAMGAVCHGYCVLPNHYHLLVETPGGNLARALHRLHAGYTATVNARRKRRGPLFRSRYRAVLLDEDPWLLRLSVHIHLNPVRKRLAGDPWSFPGSSAAAFRSGRETEGLETGRVLALAGGPEAYRKLVEGALAAPPSPPWKEVWRGLVLGGEGLRSQVLAALEGRDPREISGFVGRSQGGGLSLDQVVGLVADHTGVRPEDVLKGKFQRVLARKVGMDLARRFTGLTLREIGAAFGVDYTTVHMAGRRLEALRARDGAVDELVRSLEAQLSALSGSAGRPSAPSQATPSGRRRPGGRARKRTKPSPQLKLL